MSVSDQPNYFEIATVAPASTYDAFRELWWWMTGVHPTTINTIAYECIEVWDGTLREAPANGKLTGLSPTNLWVPTATPTASLPTGAWAVFRTLGGVVAAKAVVFVKMEASGQASHSLVSLDDWSVGGGSGASPTLPATIIGQPPTGDGDGRFPDSSTLFWSVVMDEGMFFMKQFAASGLTGFRSTYMGEVDPTTDEADDPRPFITPRNTSQGWTGSYSHMRLSPVDQSTLCELRNKPAYDLTFDVPTPMYTDLGRQYVSNVALDSSEPVGHRFSQGYFRNVGATEETAASNRATMGYTATDYRFEVSGFSAVQPQFVTVYPPGTPLGGGHTLATEESIPLQLIPAVEAVAAPAIARLLKTIRHLFPKSRQWNLVYLRDFLRLMKGITPSLDAAANNADTVWTDLIPATASERALTIWERQWAQGTASALTLAQRRTRLAGVWAATGGQSPGYITDTLQAHGFPVFVHEWWDLAPNGYPVPKDPRDHLLPVHGGNDVAGILLVNSIRTTVKFDEIGAGEAFAEAGEFRAVAGYYGGYAVGQLVDVYVGPQTRHPYYLYIGGETFPDVVNIPIARREEFEGLCQKICPAHLWLVLRVTFS